MRRQMKRQALFFGLFLVTSLSVFSIHNTSRDFPFLERPSNCLFRKKTYFHGSLFFTTASTAFKRGGGNAGIPELWGKYDLRDVIDSLKLVYNKSPKFVNPIETATGSTEFINKSIKFKVGEKIKSVGLYLNYEQDLNWNNLSVGASVPVMNVNATMRYDFDHNDFIKNLPSGKVLTPQEVKKIDLQLDKARRLTHDDIGFHENDWSASGLGDLDFHLRLNYFLDHQFLMKSISLNPQVGLLVPTGVKSDINNTASRSFMGNGHWGAYFDLASEFELKQDFKVGFIFAGIYQFKNKRTLRLPVFNEPAIFSSLIGKVEIDPGVTAKISPYIILENLADGLHFQARYTYLRHSKDLWRDVRSDKTISSFLSKSPEVGLSVDDINKNIADKESLSKWRSHYITLQMMYNSKQALNNWVMDPNVYLAYDIPINGNGISKTHHIALGIELHF